MADKSVNGPEGALALHVSIGLGILSAPEGAPEQPGSISPDYFRQVGKMLFKCADEGLYEAKHTGGFRLCMGRTMGWPPPQQLSTPPASPDETDEAL
jgi:hypothetical protein